MTENRIPLFPYFLIYTQKSIFLNKLNLQASLHFLLFMAKIFYRIFLSGKKLFTFIQLRKCCHQGNACTPYKSYPTSPKKWHRHPGFIKSVNVQKKQNFVFFWMSRKKIKTSTKDVDIADQLTDLMKTFKKHHLHKIVFIIFYSDGDDKDLWTSFWCPSLVRFIIIGVGDFPLRLYFS